METEILFYNLDKEWEELNRISFKRYEAVKQFFETNLEIAHTLSFTEARTDDYGTATSFGVKRDTPFFSMEVMLEYDGMIRGECFRVLAGQNNFELFYAFYAEDEKDLKKQCSVVDYLLRMF